MKDDISIKNFNINICIVLSENQNKSPPCQEGGVINNRILVTS